MTFERITRLLRVCIPVWIACGALASLPAFAARDAASKPDEAQTAEETEAAKKYGMTHVVAEKLLEAYALLESERYDEALAVVDALAKRRKLKDPEIAQIHRFRAYIFVNKNENRRATEEFEKSLAVGAMDPAAEQLMIYSLAQIYTEMGEYARALDLMDRWFASEKSPKADAYFLKAMILVQQQDWAAAAEPADRAIELAAKPKESWLTLHGVVHSKLENYAKVESSLERLVELAPGKPQYWMQLAAVQHHLGRAEKALATMELAHASGLLRSDKELRQLASLKFLGRQPFECAALMERGIESGAIAADADAYRLLSNCLIAARESDAALVALAKGSALAEDADLGILLGQMYLEREDFPRAIDALESALPKARQDQRGSIHLLIGIAHLGEERFAEAERAFQVATGDAKVHRAAESYLKFVADKRLAQAQAPTRTLASTSATGG